nr:hypothetical protein GCM10020092_092260 [Actinoplanes digitatis]
MLPDEHRRQHREGHHHADTPAAEVAAGESDRLDRQQQHDRFEGERARAKPPHRRLGVTQPGATRRIPVDRIPVDRTPADRTPVDRTPVGQIPVGQIPVDRGLVGRGRGHRLW